jgi:nucleoside-diphosphate-sugar epimerase
MSIDNFIGRTSDHDIHNENLVEIQRNIVTESLPNKIKFDYIINASGCASPNLYERFPKETMHVSSIGVEKVLELAKEHGAKIINFSSSEVLGTPSPENIPTGEGVIPQILSDTKRSPYDVGKLYLESLSSVYRENDGVDVKVVRLFNCIGYFRKDDFRVIPNFLGSVLDGQKMKVFLPSTQTRTFSFYTDVIVGILLVLTKGSDFLYHIGSPDNEINILDLAKKIEKVVGKTDLIELVETPEVYRTEPTRRCPDTSKITKELGYNPKVNLDEMLERIYEWAKSNY